VTVYPVYPALAGAALKRRYGVKFVLDYQDPWVGSWGLTVGGGANGSPDLRSRLTRRLGTWLEPIAVRAADAITAVSAGTYEEIVRADSGRRSRDPGSAAARLGSRRLLRLATPGRSSIVKGSERDVNVVSVGTILPKGIETLRAVLEAASRLRDQDPDAYARLRLWFLGTSNQFGESAPARVLPIARELGVSDVVREVAPRIPYAEAIAALRQAHAILLLGSTEPHYTASKLYPALLADRPILAAYHAASSVVDILTRVGGAPAIRLVTFGDEGPRTNDRVDCLARHLAAITRQPPGPARLDLTPIEDVSAPALAKNCAASWTISVPADPMSPIRLTAVLTHPVQYYAPWFRHVATLRTSTRAHGSVWHRADRRSAGRRLRSPVSMGRTAQGGLSLASCP